MNQIFSLLLSSCRRWLMTLLLSSWNQASSCDGRPVRNIKMRSCRGEQTRGLCIHIRKISDWRVIMSYTILMSLSSGRARGVLLFIRYVAFRGGMKLDDFLRFVFSVKLLYRWSWKWLMRIWEFCEIVTPVYALTYGGMLGQIDDVSAGDCEKTRRWE